MTIFYVIAALMVGLALFCILPPLLRKENKAAKAQEELDHIQQDVLRDQWRELELDLQAGTIDAAGYRSARQELERRVVEEGPAKPFPAQATPQQRWTALVLSLAIPIGAGLLYRFVGTPNVLDPIRVANAKESGNPATVAQIEGMVSKLAEKLKSNPDDVDGWRLLARSLETMGRFDQAVEAYEQLLKLTPDDTNVLTNYAVTLAIASNQRLSGKPEKLINRALEIDPANIQALALSGTVAFERKDYAEAIKSWKRIVALVPKDSEIARTLAGSISKAESLANRQKR